MADKPKEISISVISPESPWHTARVRTLTFPAGDQHSFHDIYFEARKEFVGPSKHFYFQVFSNNELDPFNGIIYYDLDSLRDDAVAFNFFGGDK